MMEMMDFSNDDYEDVDVVDDNNVNVNIDNGRDGCRGVDITNVKDDDDNNGENTEKAVPPCRLLQG